MGIRFEKWEMRSEEWGISIADQSYPLSTELSEQKVQGHVPGQGQGVKPLVSKFLVRLRSQEMGKALSEYEAEPHSVQADQAVQSKAKKAYRSSALL